MAKFFEQRRALSRREILTHYPRWSENDRQRVAQVLDTHPSLVYVYVTPGTDYMIGRDIQDRYVLYLGGGLVGYDNSGTHGNQTGARQVAEKGWTWLELSRHVDMIGGKHRAEPEAKICPKCGVYALAANGTCLGGCDD